MKSKINNFLLILVLIFSVNCIFNSSFGFSSFFTKKKVNKETDKENKIETTTKEEKKFCNWNSFLERILNAKSTKWAKEKWEVLLQKIKGMLSANNSKNETTT